jgi:hypothetical protein
MASIALAFVRSIAQTATVTITSSGREPNMISGEHRDHAFFMPSR